MNANSKAFEQGNLLLLVCCIFYLAWWVLAFRPENPVKGMRSGWLLIPAAAAGLSGVIIIVSGINGTPMSNAPFSSMHIWLTGAAVYFVLLIATSALLKRPVTTELFLIVGWATLVTAEANALYAANMLGALQAIILCAVTAVFAAISIICYLKYYDLDSIRGYVDGAVPLILVGIATAGTLFMIR